MVRRLERAGIGVEEKDSEERTVRESEIWHYYTITFESVFDLDSTSIFFREYVRPVLGKHYRNKTSLRVLVGIKAQGGGVIVTDWRSVSDTLNFGDAFESIVFNMKTWLEKGEYNVLLGISAWVRTPSWYERGKR